MFTSQLRYAAASLSDCGRRRPVNEDACGYSLGDGVFVVSDGMGGAAAGEIASSMAVEELLRHFAARHGEMQTALKTAISAANQAIYSRAGQNSRLRGMGATLVALVVEGGRMLLANIGDSRCYRLRGGRLEQLTVDHSYVEEQVRQGRMSAEEARRSPMRNVITRALGTSPAVEPDLFAFKAEPEDLFLLCSDGLTHELSDEAIAERLSADDSLEERCARLVHDAIQAGGNDNITCILLRAGL